MEFSGLSKDKSEAEEISDSEGGYLA